MKKVLITGCSRGIGRAILEQLIEKGEYEIYGISKDINEICDLNYKYLIKYEWDLSRIDLLEELAERIWQDSHGIDIIINNAGIAIFKKIEELSFKEWNEVLTVNLTAPYVFINKFLPNMKKNNYGRIINIASDSDYKGFKDRGAYCASKFGLRGLTESIRDEFIGSNITATTIGPARVDTYFRGKKPGDRPLSLKPQDVANQVIHILNQRENCCIERIYLRSTLE